VSVNLVISEICCNLKILIYKQLQTKIAMFTEDKVFRKLKEILKYFLWQMISASFLMQ